jgi:Cysteine-rich CPCC
MRLPASQRSDVGSICNRNSVNTILRGRGTCPVTAFIGSWMVCGYTSAMFKNVSESYQPQKAYRCPCCHFKTLHERGGFSLCPVCFWEDDGQDDHDADDVRGGPNGSLSLRQARLNFEQCGASDLKFASKVRPPVPDEL